MFFFKILQWFLSLSRLRVILNIILTFWFLCNYSIYDSLVRFVVLFFFIRLFSIKRKCLFFSKAMKIFLQTFHLQGRFMFCILLIIIQEWTSWVMFGHGACMVIFSYFFAQSLFEFLFRLIPPLPFQMLFPRKILVLSIVFVFEWNWK